MRSLYTYLMVVVGTALYAQQPPNFSMTDIHGKEWNMYSELSKGKTVVLDFFFVDCKPCQKLTPVVQSIYESFGSDTGNVVVFGISDRDNNSRVRQFEATYGVTYPSCGIEGGGDTITDLYQLNYTFLGWPTYAVICPDTTIFWAIEKSDSLNALTDSLNQCPEPVLSQRQPLIESNELAILVSSLKRTISISTVAPEELKQVTIFNTNGQVCEQHNLIKTTASATISTSMLQSGIYYIYIQTNEKMTVQKCIIP